MHTSSGDDAHAGTSRSGMSECIDENMVASVKNSGMHSSGVHWYSRRMSLGYSLGSYFVRTCRLKCCHRVKIMYLVLVIIGTIWAYRDRCATSQVDVVGNVRENVRDVVRHRRIVRDIELFIT